MAPVRTRTLTSSRPRSACVLMKKAFGSTRSGAESLPQTHHLIAEILAKLRPAEMQAAYFWCMEDGPESLLAPIEAEFAKRGLSPRAMTFG